MTFPESNTDSAPDAEVKFDPDAIAQPEAPSLGAQLAASRHSARSYARSIVKRWPALSEEQRAEVRTILAPVVTEPGR